MGYTVFLHVVIMALAVVSSLASECEEPENVEEIKKNLDKLIRDNYLNYMSFLNIQSTLANVKSRLKATLLNPATAGDTRSNSRKLITTLYGEPHCKKRHIILPNVNQSVSEESSCPWHYVLEVDDDRTPSAIMKARCTCMNCLVPTSYGYKKKKRASHGICEEVKYYMPVIRRTCEAGKYQYIVDIENIAVGCTCQRHAENKRHGNKT